MSAKADGSLGDERSAWDIGVVDREVDEGLPACERSALNLDTFGLLRGGSSFWGSCVRCWSVRDPAKGPPELVPRGAVNR